MRRRRHNPDPANTALTLTLFAGGAYLLYRLWNVGTQAAAAVGQGFSSASSSVADLADILFPHATGAAWVAGSTILLSTGQEIPTSLAEGAGIFTDTDGVQKIQFLYAGKTWRTTSAGPDDTHTYYAVQMS